LVVGKVDFFDTGQDKKGFVCHVRIQLGIFEGSGSENGFARPSIVGDCVRGERGHDGWDLVVNGKGDGGFLFQRQHFEV
jgi:hypothetical protein